MSTENNKNSNKDIIYISWSILIVVFLLTLVYLCFYLRNIPDYYGYYLLHGMAIVLAIGGIYFLFKYGEIKRFSPLDGWLLAAVIVPIVIYLFLSWGHYPPSLNLFFFGIPACSVQFLFYRVMRPRFVKALPMILSTCFAFWQFFIHKNPVCIEFQFPALCSILVWVICRHKNKIHW